MIEEVIIFNKKNTSRFFKLNPENTFFKLTRLEIPEVGRSKEILKQSPKFSIKYKISDLGKGSSKGEVSGLQSLITQNHMEAKFDLNDLITWKDDHSSIEFTFQNTGDIEKDVHLYYTRLDNKADMKGPFADFDFHIKQRDNTKILFSAPFGQGKTTFLNYFFEQNQSEYEVFKLYPVNYAVSHNEDIFKYIKVEILFQLMGKDVEFDKESFTYFETGAAYFKANALKIISPFISYLPKIGHSASEIYEKIYKLATEYLEYHKQIQIDDKDKALQFIHEVYEREGSIFEDNFYTQLIRQLLEQHKSNHSKKNVLIIDDLDRMDPDHIFRIFNVFSANFDSQDFKNGYPNKFGFDKIILVCDYTNIRKLFSHRYGTSSSFNGYLSKYFSKQPFYYDNSKGIEAVANSLMNHNGQRVRSTVGSAFNIIVSDLIQSEEVTLRDLLKFLKINYYNILDNQISIHSTHLKSHHGKFVYFNIIAFLRVFFDLDSIAQMLLRCRDRAPYRPGISYSSLTTLGFVPLASSSLKLDSGAYFAFKGHLYNFKIESKSEVNLNHFDYYDTVEVKKDQDSITNTTFNVKDFYDVVLLNLEKYRELNEVQ